MPAGLSRTSPYLRVFMEGRELQGWTLELLPRLSVQVWIHCYAISFVQEVKGGEGVLLRRGIVSAIDAALSRSRRH